MQGINYGFETTGNIHFDLEKINEGFKNVQRQCAMQNYEGDYISVWGYYSGLGRDYEYGEDVHVSVNNINIDNQSVDHVWLRYAALANPQVWSLLRKNEAILILGRCYSYISKDKKYSIEVEWVYNENIGWHFIDMPNLYRTMLWNS
jgi:hypothetical protein